MVFSTKYRKIIHCDSIATFTPSEQLKEDAKLLASYMFPAVGSNEWSFEVLNKQDRFQRNNLDCGFHLLNFIEAALEDRSVLSDSELFIQWKKSTAKELKIKTRKESFKK